MPADDSTDRAPSPTTAALERFLTERAGHTIVERRPDFVERYEAARRREREAPEVPVHTDLPLIPTSRATTIALPTVVHRRNDAGDRTVVADPRTTVTVRDGQPVLVGLRDEPGGAPRELELRSVGTTAASPEDSQLGSHLDVDVDAGTIATMMLPSQPQLRERLERSELTKFVDAQIAAPASSGAPTSAVPDELGEPARPAEDTETAPPAASAADPLRDTALGLLRAGMAQQTITQADVALDRIASYDYSSFELLREPVDWLADLPTQPLSDGALALINDYEEDEADIESLPELLAEIETGVLAACLVLDRPQPAELHRRMVATLYGPWAVYTVRDIVVAGSDHERLIGTGAVANALSRAMVAAARSWDSDIASGLSAPGGGDLPPVWEYEPFRYDANNGSLGEVWRRTADRFPLELDAAELHLHEHPFSLFAPHSVNLGLRLVYRQDWRLLGVQPGEVVKTVPLGPGQSMQVSTTITRRHKMDVARDTSRLVDRMTESADTVKDSTEIVRETAESHNWEIAMEGSFGYGFGLISAECTRGPSYGGSTANKSRSQSNHLNEKVRKTAGKVQTETKVHVATERETTFEQATATELRNPNDEVALTYEYLHLQHLYETFTRLAEVDSVVLVAEPLPTPDGIDADWVRRHATVLSRVLLDEVHRTALEEITTDDQVDDPNAEDVTTRMNAIMTAATDNFASFSGAGGGGGGLTIPDIYASAMKGYLDWVGEQQIAARMAQSRTTRRDRFFDHLRDNLLHYCRAIWMNEDVDQRMLRYRKLGITVPVQWNKFSMRHPIPTSVEIPIGDVIEPTPPIGFVGNYAVHRYRAPDPESMPEQLTVALNLDEAMEVLRAQYVDPDDPFAVLDPDLHGELLASTDDRNDLSDVVVHDLVHHLPRLRDDLLDADGDVRRIPGEPAKLLHPVAAADWAEYRFRKAHTDRVLLASGNLYLDLRVGAGSAVEPFKRLHRSIDGFGAIEERDRAALDNARRRALLDAEHYGDPDVERVTVVRTGDSGEVGVDVLADDTVTTG